MKMSEYNPIRTDRIGETRQMNNGMNATIIAYRFTYDIDIKFEDGTVINNVAYYSFTNGTIRNPNVKGRMNCRAYKHLGETKMMNCGMNATYIKAIKAPDDIIVRFEDGYEKHTTYSHFIKGCVSNPNVTIVRKGAGNHVCLKSCLGETRRMTNGHLATCIAYNSSKDISIKFDNGEIREHIYKCQFYRGHVALAKRKGVEL